ncbi:MAG: hypothetical protein K0S55_1569 [Clostridia bacterium]|jgi:hypothetical protein|nr:hypothetical protein [Clostridia bacterium]
MDDIFLDILTMNDIKLIYTKDNPVLICIKINDKLIVYANEIFHNCPEKIALAVIGLYTINNKEHYDIIMNYVQNIDPTHIIDKIIHVDNEIEMQIKEIKLSSDDGNNVTNTNSTIRVDDGDYIALEIVIA